MNSREKNTEISEFDAVGMHALPTELIGEIGSYLDHIDYFDFGKVCTLRNLDVVKDDDYSPIRLQPV